MQIYKTSESFPSNERQETFLHEISIALRVPVEDISKFIARSNTQQIVFHGIKRKDALENVQREGIKNLSPEGGYASYWTGGINFFGSMTESGHLNSRDSTLMDYAHMTGIRDPKIIMCCGITSAHLLNEISPIIVGQNAYLTVPFAVDPKHMSLVIVSMANTGEAGIMQLAEKKLFLRLNDLVQNGFVPGSIYQD